MKFLPEFFAFAKERESIREKKEAGASWPWTDDPYLQRAFFCNIYREDDKTTRWFAKNMRNPYRDDEFRSLLASVMFRWFNKIETGQVLLPWLHAANSGWTNAMWSDWGRSLRMTLEQMSDSGFKVFSAAYIISSPLGLPKIMWATGCIVNTMLNADVILKSERTLESLWSRLAEEQGLGPFMAYEIVTDLRHTSVLENAPDIQTWANPGPGARRGLGWVCYGFNKGAFTNSRGDRREMIEKMQIILAESKKQDWISRPWEMREVEHTLCEFDKYMRVSMGDRPKRWYHK